MRNGFFMVCSFGNWAIFLWSYRQKTPSFASPPHDGFAIIENSCSLWVMVFQSNGSCTYTEMIPTTLSLKTIVLLGIKALDFSSLKSIRAHRGRQNLSSLVWEEIGGKRRGELKRLNVFYPLWTVSIFSLFATTTIQMRSFICKLLVSKKAWFFSNLSHNG